MATAAVSSHGHSRTPASQQLGISRRIRAYFIARRVQRRTFEELDMTSDRELADMCLSRLDVGPLSHLAGRQAAEKFLSA